MEFKSWHVTFHTHTHTHTHAKQTVGGFSWGEKPEARVWGAYGEFGGGLEGTGGSGTQHVPVGQDIMPVTCCEDKPNSACTDNQQSDWSDNTKLYLHFGILVLLPTAKGIGKPSEPFCHAR